MANLGDWLLIYQHFKVTNKITRINNNNDKKQQKQKKFLKNLRSLKIFNIVCCRGKGVQKQGNGNFGRGGGENPKKCEIVTLVISSQRKYMQNDLCAIYWMDYFSSSQKYNLFSKWNIFLQQIFAILNIVAMSLWFCQGVLWIYKNR